MFNFSGMAPITAIVIHQSWKLEQLKFILKLIPGSLN